MGLAGCADLARAEPPPAAQATGSSSYRQTENLKWRASRKPRMANPPRPAAIEETVSPSDQRAVVEPVVRAVAEAPLASPCQGEQPCEAGEVVQVAAESPAPDPFADPFGDAAPADDGAPQLFADPAMELAQDAVDPLEPSPTLPGPEGDAAPLDEDAPFEFEPMAPKESDAPTTDQPSTEAEMPLPSDPSMVEPEPLDTELAQGPSSDAEVCPSPRDLKRINQITNEIDAEPGNFPIECGLGDELYQPRAFAQTTYCWKASGLCHKPLYFEDMPVERYGHTCGPLLQPLASGAHFFASIPALPYKMGVNPPWECIYPLGYYRPGSCAPHMIYPVPLSLRGGLAEAGAVTGLLFIFP